MERAWNLIIKKSKKVVSTKQKIIQDRWNWCWQNISFRKEPYVTNKSVKHFIGNNNDDVVMPLYIKLPQMNRYVKSFGSNKTMSFKVTSKNLLKKYTKIW